MKEEGAGVSRLQGTPIVWAVVAVIAIVAVYLLAQKVLLNPTAKLTVETDAQGKVRIGVEGGDQVLLQDVLQRCWDKEHKITHGIICSWGLDKQIIDPTDADSIKQFGLVPSTSFWDLWLALKNNHLKPDNIKHIDDLRDYFHAAAPLEKRPMTLTWEKSENISPTVMNFPQGDAWFAKRLHSECAVVITNEDRTASTNLIVDSAIPFAKPDRIQVSEGTFVKLIGKSRGIDIQPALRSQAWKKLLEVGKVQVDVVC